MKLAYQRKTRDRWDIETNYGYGWEVENSEYNRGGTQSGRSGNTRRTWRHTGSALSVW